MAILAAELFFAKKQGQRAGMYFFFLEILKTEISPSNREKLK